MYYLLSLKHTMPREKYLTFWGPNNAGYCYSKNRIGSYPELEEGYHNSESTMPIECSKVNELFKPFQFDGRELMMIKNSEINRGLLGVKFSKGKLVRLKP